VEEEIVVEGVVVYTVAVWLVVVVVRTVGFG
jgi:hypothetical protein